MLYHKNCGEIILKKGTLKIMVQQRNIFEIHGGEV
jgi:hypothetical protein